MAKGLSKPRFEAVFKNGKRANGPICRLSALPGSGLVGIATSSKIGCHARRNKVKRRVRAAIQALNERINPKLDYVVIVSLSGSDVELGEIRHELETLLAKMNERWADDLECS